MQKILLLGCLLLSLIVAPVNVQDTTTPYIHYYSELAGGLIIERADGTDSRLIPDVGDGTPVWSPSGKWLVVDNTTVISADGTQRVDFPRRSEHLTSGSVRWAPDEDVLLIVSTDDLYDTLRSQIYDVEEDLILAEFSIQTRGIPAIFELHWASTGERAFIGWHNHLITLYRNGTSKVQINAWDWPFTFHRGRLLHYYRTKEEAPYKSGVIIQDVETQRQIELGDGLGWPQAPVTVRWNSTLDQVLIYARNCSNEECDSSLRLVDWQSGNIVSVIPNVTIPPHFENRECFYSYQCQELWSPDGTFATLIDEEGGVHILNTSTGQTRQIATDVTYQWSSDDTLLIRQRGGLRRYDPVTDQETEIALSSNFQSDMFDPSPDGKLIGVRSNPPTIVDLSGNLVAQTTAHSDSVGTVGYPTAGYLWHGDQEWVLINYHILFAGGGGVGGPITSVLFRLDGTVRRELPTGGAAGFVPERAIPHLAPGQVVSVKKEPIFTLPQLGVVLGIGWHPTDPDQLVTYSQEEGLLFWSLAEGKPVITDRIVPPTAFPPMFPVDLKLFWLPEQNIVAFFERGMLYYIDFVTGDIIPVEDIDYPTLETNEAGVFVGEMRVEIHLEPERDLNARRMLTSGRDGFIVSRGDYDYFMSYINADTGAVTHLDVSSYLWATDARHNIAAFGSVYDCCVTIASTETGAAIDEFYGTAYSLALSADGRRLATTSRGLTSIWDMSAYLQDE